MSYILIKAGGLPSIQVSAAASAPAMQPPVFIGSGFTSTPTNVTVTWFGPASLAASDVVTGPWTNVVSTTNSYVTPLSKLKAAEFYRLQYSP